MANLFCCFLSMGLVFVPKILFIRKHAHDPREREEDKQEEERRYKEVVKENELLQKKVQEVSRVHTVYSDWHLGEIWECVTTVIRWHFD